MFQNNAYVTWRCYKFTKLCDYKNIKRSIITDVVSKPKDQAKVNNDSFALNSFRGNVAAKRVFPFPDILTHDRTKLLQKILSPTETLLKEVNDPAKNESQNKVDDDVLKELWKIGLFGALVPKDWGGLGLNNTQFTRLLQTVGQYDLSIGVILRSHQFNGLRGIMMFGTDDQKAKYLTRVTKGEYAAFCLREPGIGSDYKSVKSTATLSGDKSHYVINGSKIFITNGDVSEIMTVFAQTEVKDEHGENVNRLTAFIVEKAFGGVTVGSSPNKMGIKAVPTTEIKFDDVKVPVGNVLGGIGRGIEVALSVTNSGRYGIAALLSGAMRGCINKAAAFSRNHVQFKKSIRSFELTQQKLARMAILQYVAETMAYVISSHGDNQVAECYVEAAISKCFSTEAAWNVCDECIQVMGGVGYMTQTGLERMLRDIRSFRILEIGNDVVRMIIALAGMRYAELNSTRSGFQKVSKITAQTIGLGSSPTLEPYVDSHLTTAAKLAGNCVYNFGNVVDTLLVRYGEDIDSRQMLLGRIADCAIDIFAMACVLSRATSSLRQNLPSAGYEKLIAETWCIDASERITNNLNGCTSGMLLDNLRNYVLISELVSDAAGVAQLSPLRF